MSLQEASAPVSWVEGRREAAADLARSLVGIDTANPPGRTDEAVEWIEGRLDEWGIEHRRVVAESAKPNLIATIPGQCERTLLFNGHLDTVPYSPGQWTRDPLGERDGDRLYGRGAEDMKGPIAALLLAARAYAETETTPKPTVQFAFVADEETDGHAGTRTLLARDAVDPECCVVAETTSTPDRRSVTVAERGRLWLTLETTGQGAHGSRPMLGVNAIDCLGEAIDACRQRLSDCSFPVEQSLESVVEESVAFYEPAMGEEAARRLFERPTVNLGTISGGQAVNSVPERAVAELDVRLPAGVGPMSVLSELCEVVEGFDRTSVTEVSSTVGTYEASNSPIVGPAVEAARRVTGDRIYTRCASGGSDARLFRAAGIPSVEFALGVGTAHATDEHTTLGTILDNASAYALLPQLC